MNQSKKDFLSLVTAPARVGINETAWLLGSNEHDIPVLVSQACSSRWGRPPSSGSKFFATVELQNLRTDTRWLAKASDTIVNYWRAKNGGRRSKGEERAAIAA